ncbi:CoA ester lyase [Sphingosinicella sp.]|jgi:citrate lyase beta subunit|uniref:HpcH/HpaI aldolase/citrate lyase family protein n=1 Tax=Sphingosinicella sp. TaxID=1917971 RepID=UPI0017CAB4EC|nr:CoA ester lyase [Sphingosinicella sp.]MBA4758880.1 CoA ester lyase [Sphingosinicella sp.]
MDRAASCLLFVPGNRPERFEKALATGAELVCIDLEDAVPPAAKDETRATVIAALPDLPRERIAVRVNGMRTEAGLRDLLALKDAGPLPLLLVPMVESAGELAPLQAVGAPAIIPLIETAKGLAAAVEIAAAEAVVAMMFGGGDLSAELGVALEWEPLAAARGQFILACARARVPAIDVPFIHIADPEGLAEEVRRAKSLGFSAKAAIHPAQVEIIQGVLRPQPSDIEEARAALQAFAEAGGQAVMFKGRMLEAPFMRRLERLAAFGESRNA